MKLSLTRRRTGFTLIELIVVISIIVVLGTIAAVTIMSSSESKDVARCRENLGQIGALAQLYKDDKAINRGRMLPTSGMPDNEATENFDESEGWWVSIARKSDSCVMPTADGDPVKVDGIFRCPGDDRAAKPEGLFEASAETISYVSWTPDEENGPIRTAALSERDLSRTPWLSDGEPVKGSSVTDFASFKSMVMPAVTRHKNTILVLYADLVVRPVEVLDAMSDEDVYKQIAPLMPDAAAPGKAAKEKGKKDKKDKKGKKKSRASREDD